MEDNKIINYNKRSYSLYFTIIVFVLIFIYLVVSYASSHNKKKVQIYEVNKSIIKDSSTFNALVVRDEQIIKSDSDGYISFYCKDGIKLKKNDIICSINSTVANNTISDNSLVLDSEEMIDIRNFINEYSLRLSSSNYEKVSDFKYSLESKLYELNYMSSMSENSTSVEGNIYSATEPGIITYTITGYENVDIANISKDIFEEKIKKPIFTFAKESVKQGDEIYKIIYSQNWSFIIELSDKDIEYLNDLEANTIEVVISSTGQKMKGKYNLFTSNGSTFAKIDFEAYLSNFIDTSFVDIEIVYNIAEGLKIPTSSIISKNFYKIPNDCIYYLNGVSNINIETVSADGTPINTLQRVTLFYSNDDYVCIDMSSIKDGQNLTQEAKEERFIVGEQVSLEGVYSVNKGYTVFRRVEKVFGNDSFSVVKIGTSYGLSQYDHIVTDGTAVNEADIIY